MIMNNAIVELKWCEGLWRESL